MEYIWAGRRRWLCSGVPLWSEGEHGTHFFPNGFTSSWNARNWRGALATCTTTRWYKSSPFYGLSFVTELFCAGAAIADLATQQDWASQFLDQCANADQTTTKSWTDDFLNAHPPPTGSMPLAPASTPVESTQWAKDFIASNEHKEWSVIFAPCWILGKDFCNQEFAQCCTYSHVYRSGRVGG